MNLRTLIVIAAASLCVAGCEQKKSAAEVHAEKEKAWRIAQRPKAIKYYGKLLKNYPDSEYAEKARARLDAMNLTAAERTIAYGPKANP